MLEMITQGETLTSDIIWGLTFFSALDRWKRMMVEAAIKVAKMKLSAISATAVMHMSVSGQCDSVNESKRVNGEAGGSGV